MPIPPIVSIPLSLGIGISYVSKEKLKFLSPLRTSISTPVFGIGLNIFTKSLQLYTSIPLILVISSPL